MFVYVNSGYRCPTSLLTLIFFILGQPTLIKRNLIKNFLFNIKNAVNMNFSLIKLLFNDVLVINDVKPLIINDIYEINTIYKRKTHNIQQELSWLLKRRLINTLVCLIWFCLIYV